MKASRFSRRRAGREGRKGTGIGVAPEVLDEVLKNEGVKKDTVDGEEERIEAAINTSIQNRDLNEPVNREAIKAEYTPTKSFQRSHRYSQEDRDSKESSPYSLKTKTYSTNNNEQPVQQKLPPPPPSSSSSSESEPEPSRNNERLVGNNNQANNDLQLEIEDLQDEIEELRLQLRQKDTIIAEKDLEISRLKRSARRTRQPRQSDF